MTQSNQTSAELAARRTAAAAVLADYRRELASAPLSRPPGREWMLRLATVLDDLLSALARAAEPPLTASEAAGDAGLFASGPFETERQAAELPEVRAIYGLMGSYTGRITPGMRSKIDGATSGLITGACERAGVELGAYDRRIVAWLGNWEPQTCAVIAGLISRAASPDARNLGEPGTGECPGCPGRGTGQACCICGLPIPVALRRRPGDPSEIDGGAR